ncbi:peptidoglycan-binding protein [Streptomyces sp. NBC_01241]|uniref:peptidoglycan-binding protein n=1 Tax=Streptomyces sp. NBC_01241 TaxID=2903794 RepID=UPI00352C0190|nr:peptidoglycan-binding protein [Streptomyces sp. NBC_01241]
MTSQVAQILTLADKEVGYQEGRSNGHWNNWQKYSPAVPGLEWSQNQAWCATWISWLALQADISDLYPRTASCLTGVSWFKNKGQFSEYPAVGAQVFFGKNGGTHTGIVYKYDATYVYTYEGNTNENGSPEGDGVYEKKHARRDSYVYGYGYPKFSEDLVTADPSKKDEAGFSYKTSATVPAAPVKSEPKPATPKPSSPRPKPVSYEPYPGESYFKKAPNSPLITRLGKRLVAEGCSAYVSGPGRQWTEADRKSYRKWQLKLGYRGTDADGWPGKASWDKLRVTKG